MHSASPPFSGASISSNRYLEPSDQTVSPSTTHVIRGPEPQMGNSLAQATEGGTSASAATLHRTILLAALTTQRTQQRDGVGIAARPTRKIQRRLVPSRVSNRHGSSHSLKLGAQELVSHDERADRRSRVAPTGRDEGVDIRLNLRVVSK